MPVRKAEPDDLPVMKHLASEAPEAAQWSNEEWDRLFSPGSIRVALVFEESTPILGFVIARALGPEWELENIAVSVKARRRGVARKLVDELITTARSHGAAALYLEVRESNRAARALYQSCGFAESGRRSAYYAAPTEDAILYKFSFSSPAK